MIEIDQVEDNPRRLSQAVMQVTAMLGLYHAELARILQTDCPGIGQLASGQQCLQQGTTAWRQACLLVRCYRALYRLHAGDGTAMYHWLHVYQPALGGIPHLLLVDEQQLAAVVKWLEAGTAGEP
jgi:hypothetical protein